MSAIEAAGDIASSLGGIIGAAQSEYYVLYKIRLFFNKRKI